MYYSPLLLLSVSCNLYVVFPLFPPNPIASSAVVDAISIFLMSSDLPVMSDMAAFTGKNKEHYFQTDLATVQTNVSQPGFHRTHLGFPQKLWN